MEGGIIAPNLRWSESPKDCGKTIVSYTKMILYVLSVEVKFPSMFCKKQYFLTIDFSDTGSMANFALIQWNSRKIVEKSIFVLNYLWLIKTPFRVHSISKISSFDTLGDLLWRFREGGQSFRTLVSLAGQFKKFVFIVKESRMKTLVLVVMTHKSNKDDILQHWATTSTMAGKSGW